MLTVVRKIKDFCNQLLERFRRWQDFRLYARNFSSFENFLRKLTAPEKGTVLVISGRGMNYVWAQAWTVFCVAAKAVGYNVVVLTSRQAEHLNRYFKLGGMKMIFYEDFLSDFSGEMPAEVAKKIKGSHNLAQYRKIVYNGIPVGEIAVSTYSRYHGTGVIRFDDEKTVGEIGEWIRILCQAEKIAAHIYEKHDAKMLFFVEIFFEEYGAFYYAALARKLNVIKFTGTIRDNAFILQHLSSENDRQHHASLSGRTWSEILQRNYTSEIDGALRQNFMDRYGTRWHRSKRNHPNTRIFEPEEASKMLGIQKGRKVAVIYSHILYDSLFFFGTDLFDTYAEWFVETIRAACKNHHVDWFVKVHPSNLWRGELDPLLKGKYEEERLIENSIGKLPAHVHVVRADTSINPYTWFRLADYGITVRGTAGLEMAALGKTVVTAGTGRYEGNGFTLDPGTKEEYLDILGKLHEVEPLTVAQRELAKRYTYSLFVLKPVTFSSLLPRLRSGAKKVLASDDITFLPAKFNGDMLPEDLAKFAQWIEDEESLELLSTWGTRE